MEPVARRAGAALRALGAGAVGLGGPALTWSTVPELGVALIALEALIVLVVMGAALFGSGEISERAFRLLRWVANRPEPKAPPGRRRAAE